MPPHQADLVRLQTVANVKRSSGVSFPGRKILWYEETSTLASQFTDKQDLPFELGSGKHEKSKSLQLLADDKRLQGEQDFQPFYFGKEIVKQRGDEQDTNYYELSADRVREQLTNADNLKFKEKSI